MKWMAIVRRWKRIVGKLVSMQRDDAMESDTFDQAMGKALDVRRMYAPGLPFKPGSIGIALSGGGIRSATICLGALQALARRGRLLDFDYVSTVSGGGYAGTFLTSLFLPESARGLDGRASASADDDAICERAKTAMDALMLSNCCSEMSLTERNRAYKVRSPIWWLREHGRYLAPNGATDYAAAITYYIRAWIAMLYVFALPLFAVALASNAASMAVLRSLEESSRVAFIAWLQIPTLKASVMLSPWFAVAAAMLFLSVAAGLAYWQTEWLPRTIRRSSDVARRFSRSPRLRFAVYSTAWTVVTVVVACVLSPPGEFQPVSILFSPESYQRGILAWGLALLFISQLIGIAVLLRLATRRGDDFTSGFRGAITRTGTWLNIALLVAVSLAVIDTAALFLQSSTRWFEDYSIATGIVVPALAWLINWIADRDGGSKARQFLARYLRPLLFVAGTVLFALLAVSVHVFMYKLVYIPELVLSDTATWKASNFHIISMVTALLLLLTGTSTGFINLSSLHNLYAARLTRAYLGATNLERLRDVADPDMERPITQTHDKDDIEIEKYAAFRTAAPIHLINITLNETRNHEESQIVERDRKGIPVVFGPEGVLVDAARSKRIKQPFFYNWNLLSRRSAERLTVGQLCAISGAAASSGMGAYTTLGSSMTMTFANIRLGYWWYAGNLIKRAVRFRKAPLLWLYLKTTGVLRTYFYLFNEMTARYSRDYARLSLSDGGHFENSGVYELLRRNVRVILALDNGADPNYQFGDLENLVRKARIDLGLSVNAATAEDIEKFFGKEGAKLFLNGSARDWRGIDMQTFGPEIGLLLNVYHQAEPQADSSGSPSPCAYIVWLKPRRKADLPTDIDGYALANPAFPHESTGDQFFTEAQWESYRGLGYANIDALFSRTERGVDVLRALLPRETKVEPAS